MSSLSGFGRKETFCAEVGAVAHQLEQSALPCSVNLINSRTQVSFTTVEQRSVALLSLLSFGVHCCIHCERDAVVKAVDLVAICSIVSSSVADQQAAARVE